MKKGNAIKKENNDLFHLLLKGRVWWWTYFSNFAFLLDGSSYNEDTYTSTIYSCYPKLTLNSILTFEQTKSTFLVQFVKSYFAQPPILGTKFLPSWKTLQKRSYFQSLHNSKHFFLNNIWVFSSKGFLGTCDFGIKSWSTN